MTSLIPLPAINAPALIAAAGERTQTRFWEFFVSNIRNPHTRRALAGSARARRLYDRRRDEIGLDEVERAVI